MAFMFLTTTEIAVIDEYRRFQRTRFGADLMPRTQPAQVLTCYWCEEWSSLIGQPYWSRLSHGPTFRDVAKVCWEAPKPTSLIHHIVVAKPPLQPDSEYA